MKKTISLIVLNALCFSLAGLLAFIPMKKGFIGYLANSAFDAAHFPAALLMTVLVIALSRQLRWPVWPGLLLLFTGLLAVELVQPLVGRTASIADIAWGVAGVILGFFSSILNGHLRKIALLTCLLAFSFSLYPFATKLYALWSAKKSLPELYDFSQSTPSQLWQPITKEAFIHDKSESLSFLRVITTEAEWSGINWQNPGIAFSEYKEICFDVRSEATPKIFVRIDDQLSYSYKSRFNRHYLLGPIWQRLCLPLDHLNTESGRALDKSSLSHLFFFVKGGKAPTTFDMANIQLQ